MADSRVEQFLSMSTLSDLGAFLGITEKAVGFFAFSGVSFYRTFEVPKKNSEEKRKIYAPVPKLKRIQRDLNEVLQQLYDMPTCVHGFVAERSIVTNAKNHTGKRFVVRIDLKDFFPSITGGRIRGLFQAKPFYFPDVVADALTNLVCCKGRLPQGAPTSPVLSNMICRKMDYFISRYARDHGIRYTRYADDLTFSSTRKSSLRFLAAETDDGLLVNEKIAQIIEDNDFVINHRKTTLRGKGSRQTATGVVVNQKCNFKRSDYRDLRAMFHNWEINGLDAAIKTYLEYLPQMKPKYCNEDGIIDGERFKDHIRGKLNFYSMIAAGNKKPSVPLQRLWSSYYDLTHEPVPVALPEYSVYMTSAQYTYVDRKGAPKSFLAEGTAFLLNGSSLISAAHCCCAEDVDLTQCEDAICVTRDNVLERIEVPRFSTNFFYDTAALGDFPGAKKYPSLYGDASYRPQIGETVAAYGYAYESQRNGSARLFRKIKAEVSELLANGVYRVNRPLIQGMSGGPVLNSCGKVIGVITQGCKSDEYDLDGGFVSIGNVKM